MDKFVADVMCFLSIVLTVVPLGLAISWGYYSIPVAIGCLVANCFVIRYLIRRSR